MERYRISLEASAKAIKLMKDHDIPPSAENMMVWYAYFSDANSESMVRLDKLIENRKVLSEREFKDGVCKVLLLLADCPEFFDSLIEAHTSLGSVLAGLSEVEGEMTEFCGALKHSSEELRTAPDLPSARNMVFELLRETDRMAARQRDLAEKLQDTSREVQRLQTCLSEARSLANTDTLTGLYNRNYVDDRLSHLMTNAAEERASLCLLLIDIDNFRKINQKFGRPMGDKMLHLIANIIKKAVRDDDLAVRYDGEEFLLVLNRTSLNNAIQLGERICMDISGRNLSQRDSDNLSERITATVGIARYEPGESVMRLLERCEMAMRDGKKKGKGQVVVFGDA